MEFLRKLTGIIPDLITETGRSVKIPHEPFMTLTVENIGPGPRRMPALSIAHYGEQNGDLMRDPEMCFEMEIENGTVKEFHPYYWRNDYAGVEQNSVDEETGHVHKELERQHREFAATWSRNLSEQGFLRSYRDPEGKQ